MEIRLEFISNGKYRVHVTTSYGSSEFVTNDTQIVDDIKEMNNDGFESNLCHFESFNEIKQWAFENAIDNLTVQNQED